jgi:hypothetical protein
VTDKPPALVVVGDLHANSPVGLMPPTFTLDTGNVISANPAQRLLWSKWEYLWEYATTRFAVETVIVNGDIPNGINARDVETLTTNESDQIRFGVEVLGPVQKVAEQGAEVWVVRGTGYHSGGAGSREESIAREIGACRYESGRYSNYERWLDWRGKLVHAMHHISSAQVYPYTPLARELMNYRIRAQGGDPMPDIAVRNHVHKCHVLQENDGRVIATAPAWQLSTEFIYKVAGPSKPHLGGLIFWLNEENEIQIKRVLFEPPRAPVHRVTMSSSKPLSDLSGSPAKSGALPKRSLSKRRGEAGNGSTKG